MLQNSHIRNHIQKCYKTQLGEGSIDRRLNLSYVHGRKDCPPRCHHHLLDQSQLQSRSMHYAEALLEHHS